MSKAKSKPKAKAQDRDLEGIKALGTHNLELSVEQENNLLNLCEEMSMSARRAQGVEDESGTGIIIPRYGSWMWHRWAAQKSMRHDYTWRSSIPGEELWSKSNRSAGAFEEQVEQAMAEIKRKMLKTHRFFNYKEEGGEDKGDPVKLVERRMHYRARKMELRDTLEDAVLKAVFGGEAVVKPTLKQGAKVKRYKDNLLLGADGRPARTRGGGYVGKKDQWINQADGVNKVLAKDDSFVIPIVGAEKYTDNEEVIYGTEVYNDGADVSCVHAFDFICDPRWTSLKVSNYKAQELGWTMDQIEEHLASFEVHAENVQRFKELMRGGSARLPGSFYAQEELGEDDTELEVGKGGSGTGAVNGDEQVQPLIRLREEYIRVNVLGLRACQNIYVLREVENNIPICYAFTDDVISWDDDADHPFEIIRAKKAVDRWHGIGYFHDMYDDFMGIDETKNVMRLEVINSGNANFIKKKLIKNTANGGKFRIRGNVPNELENGVDANDVFVSIPIVAQTQELQQQFDFDLARLRSKHGQITPGSSDGMEGAETLGGMEMIQDKASTKTEATTDTLSKGMDKVIRTVATIEMNNLNEADLVKQMGRENADKVITFVKTKGWQFSEALDTMLANSNNFTSLAKNQQLLTVKQAWNTWDPAYQEVDKDLFVPILRGFDVEDTDKLLITKLQADAIYQSKVIAAQQAAQAAAEAAGIQTDQGAGAGGEAPPGVGGQAQQQPGGGQSQQAPGPAATAEPKPPPAPEAPVP